MPRGDREGASRASVCVPRLTDAARGKADAKRTCLEQPHETTQPVVSSPTPPAPVAAPAPAPSSASSEVSRAISQLRRAAGAEEVDGCCARLQAAMQEEDLRAGVLERIEDVIVSCHPERPSMQTAALLPPARLAAPACRRAPGIGMHLCCCHLNTAARAAERIAR